MRVKMDRAQLAKQFAPFAALKGFEEALREKERIIVPKVELYEEKKAEIDSILISQLLNAYYLVFRRIITMYFV